MISPARRWAPAWASLMDLTPRRRIRRRSLRRDGRSRQEPCCLRSVGVVVIVVGNYFCCRFLRGQRRLALQPRLPHPRRNHCAPRGFPPVRKTCAPNKSASDCHSTIGILSLSVKPGRADASTRKCAAASPSGWETRVQVKHGHI